jgi:hypothetical protein
LGKPNPSNQVFLNITKKDDLMKFPKNHKSLYRNVLLITPGLLAIAACSGGGDSSVPPADTTPPSITVTSHTDNQEIIGDRTITLQGTVSDDTQSVSILQNGASATTKLSGNTFSADITLADRNNTLEISATDAANNRANVVVNLHYPFLSFVNGQEAAMVIGQADFVSREVNRGNATPSANSLDTPSGNMAIDSNSNLYLSDSGNNRILVFTGIPTEFDINASGVIGQPDFESRLAATNSSSLNFPTGIYLYNDKQFIADTGNNRVLIWSLGAAEADVVIGQQSFITATADCSRNTLNFPYDVLVVEGKVIVADTYNHRVLIWNEIPTQNGQDADIVLGQQGFDSCTANDGDGDGVSETSPSANTFNYAGSVWSDGTRLVVADASNNRVLIWNTFPTQSGQDADIVLGQSAMTTNDSGTTQASLSSPSNIRSNKNQLFLTDYWNLRVLIWDTFPTKNNEPASRVLGFDNFDTGTFIDTNRTSFGGPFGLLISDDKLLVADEDNKRVMIFQAP